MELQGGGRIQELGETENDLLYDSVGRTPKQKVPVSKAFQHIQTVYYTPHTSNLSSGSGQKDRGIFLPSSFMERMHCSQAFAHTQTQRLREGVTRHELPRQRELT